MCERPRTLRVSMMLAQRTISAKIFFIKASVVFFGLGISFAQAAGFQDGWNSARAMGMGGAYTAVAEYGDAMMYNPAMLARTNGVQWTIANPWVGLSGQQALEIMNTAGSGAEFADTLNDLYGKALWIGAGAMTSFVMPHFGFAAYTSGSGGVDLHNPAYPELNANYIFDYGFALSTGFDLAPGIWSVGATFKRINRTGSNLPLGASVISELDPDAIAAQLKNRGTGYGLDVSTMLTLPSPLRPTLVIAMKNAGSLQFSHEGGLRAPPGSDPDFTVGGSLSFESPLADIRTAFDYRYADRGDVQVGKKINLGIEFDFPLLEIRAGLHQGYYTLGTAFDLGFMALDLATYGVELGEYPGQLEDRRYLLQVSFGIGLDGLFGKSSSAGGSSAGSGSRSYRLKQRR